MIDTSKYTDLKKKKSLTSGYLDNTPDLYGKVGKIDTASYMDINPFKQGPPLKDQSQEQNGSLAYDLFNSMPQQQPPTIDQPTEDDYRALKGDSTLQNIMQQVKGDTGMPSQAWGLGKLQENDPAMDWIKNNPVASALYRLSQLGNNKIFNGGEQIPGQEIVSTGNDTADKVVDFLSYGALGLNPAAGLQSAGANLASKGLSKVAPKLGGTANNLISNAAGQAAFGAGFGAQEAAAKSLEDPNYSGGQALKDIGTNAALFGGGDLALRGAGKGLKMVADKFGITDAFRNVAERLRGKTNESPAVSEAPNAETMPAAQQTRTSFPATLRGSDPQQAAMQEFEQGVEMVRNYLGHDDILAAYPQGTPIESALADIRKNTGVDLEALLSNVEKAQTPALTRTLQDKAAVSRLGRAAGAFETKPINPARERVQGQVQGVRSVPSKQVPITQAPEQTVKNIESAQPIAGPAPKIIEPPLNSGQLKERGFNRTVRTSEHSAEDVSSALAENPSRYKQRSHAELRAEANRVIDRVGEENVAVDLLNKRKLTDFDMTVAQILAKRFQSRGDEASLNKALDIIAKTGKGGTELGQAISALQQWNKMDKEGALLIGTRIVNKGKPLDEYRSLTAEEAKPITDAAAKYQRVETAKSLADQVREIVTNKKPGEKLTDAEMKVIQQFQKQINELDSKVKQFLPRENKKPHEVVKEVSKIPPGERKRDQVVSFLDAKAEQARKRLAMQRNIGFAAQVNNPVIDYAIIGSSHIARGLVKFADFTEVMVKEFGNGFKPYALKVYVKAVNIFRKENGLPTVQELERVVSKAVRDERFTEEDASMFKAWVAEIGFYADVNLKREAVQDLQAALKEIGESTLGNKISAIHTAGMLLNAVTPERNVLGGASQLVLEKVNKIATVPIDWTLSKITGEQRTIYWRSMNLAKFWPDVWAGTKSGYKGVSPSGTLESYGVHPNVFGKKNPLKYMTKLLGASLQGFDYAFYNHFKGEVLATYAENLGRVQGMTRKQMKENMQELIIQLDEQINELADYAGKYATYQDETLLSNASELLKKGLNEASTGIISRKLVNMGLPKKLSLEGFGAGDIVNKFTKTPANLIMRGLDYSPIGFIRAFAELSPLVFNRSKFNQFEASRALGRAITGTLGLTGMGYILADAGILTGSASMDKDTRSIQEQSGQGAYKVNLSALKRFFLSNFDYNAAKYQKGDTLMDYAWLQPAAISVAMGVNAQKAVADKKNGIDVSGWKIAQKALLGGIQTILENPMVQGISQVVDATSDIVKKQDPTKLYNIAKGTPASFVPTLSNQLRTATDNQQRETFDKNLFTEMVNLMKNKLPGLSKTLPTSYDSLGNAREKIQGGQADTIGQYLNAFFNPAKITEYKVSPEAQIVLELMNQSGDQNILPRIENRYFHIDQGKNMKDLKVDLTAEQYSQLQQYVGRLVTSKLAMKSDYLSNPNVSLRNKVDAVKAILTDAGVKAREQIGTQMGYKKTTIKK